MGSEIPQKPTNKKGGIRNWAQSLIASTQGAIYNRGDLLRLDEDINRGSGCIVSEYVFELQEGCLEFSRCCGEGCAVQHAGLRIHCIGQYLDKQISLRI